MGVDPREPFDSYVSKLITFRAMRLAHHPAFRGTNPDDHAQELALRLVKVRCKHDPKLSSFHTYADRVLTNHSINMINEQKAERRDPRRIQYLDDAHDEHRVALARTTAQSDLRLDLEQIMAEWPEDQRLIAKLRIAGSTPAEISRDTGFSREKVRSAFRQIEKRVRDANIAPDSTE
jgi:RNA polymerase sigma factor (sigma-70 family)